MNTLMVTKLASGAFRPLERTLCSLKGSILVYLVVVILIFGVLGVTIVSLFTTATSSSATPNFARRAFYLKDSGMRYALSELRNSNFNTGVINTLNSTTYSADPLGTFRLNIFGPWFESSAQYSFSGGGTLTVTVPEGDLPGFIL